MLKDSQLLMDVYKRYLEVTSDFIVILERNYEKMNNGDSQEIKQKREEFVKHTQNTISSFHNDLHNLFKISWELKEIEDKK